jgi:outer membrane receptor protein involved in Fe transport
LILNDNLKPETTTSAEAGFELGFFQDRVHLDVSAYNTNSINQIVTVDVSPSTGYSQKLINGGSINNKGIEVQLGLTPIKSKEFTWDITTNYSLNRSKVVKLDDEGRLQSIVLGTDRTVQVLAALGRPYGTLYGNAYTRDARAKLLSGPMAHRLLTLPSNTWVNLHAELAG